MSDLVERLRAPIISFEDNSSRRYQALATEAADELERLRAENEALRKDAERYRWLRECHWSTSPLCVVRDPKSSARLGQECPSRELLDAAIDAALAEDGQ